MYGGDYQVGCEEFQAMLAGALDGTLLPTQQAAFEAHRQACPLCAEMHAQAEAGLGWLRILKEEEVVPPPPLYNSILWATSRAELPLGPSWWQQVRDYLGLVSFWRAVSQPRFAMSFAMAFVALSATLSLTGVRLGELRTADLRPSALVRDFYDAHEKVVHYYDNLKLVYRFESRLREWQQMTAPDRPAGTEAPREPRPKPEQSPHHSEQNGLRPTLALAPRAVCSSGADLPEAEISGLDEHRRCL